MVLKPTIHVSGNVCRHNLLKGASCKCGNNKSDQEEEDQTQNFKRFLFYNLLVVDIFQEHEKNIHFFSECGEMSRKCGVCEICVIFQIGKFGEYKLLINPFEI